MKPISVVHIATYVNGGAGIAAYRIHKAMLDAGIHSGFICTDDFDEVKYSGVVRIAKPAATIWSRAVNKLKRLSAQNIPLPGFNYPQYFTARLARIKNNLNCEITSLPFSEYHIPEHPLVKNADIIHLHWVAGLLHYPSFFKKIHKPIVWTFHDMNPLLGLYHYPADEQRNHSISSQLDKQIKEIKQESMRKSVQPLHIVCPSHWMYQQVLQLGLFPHQNIHQIGNTHDETIFCLKDKAQLRAAWNIPAQNTVLVFVAQSVHNYRKGFDLLADALRLLEGANITLLVIGEQPKEPFSHFQCLSTGFIQNEEEISKCYSLADAFVLPSREDNLPNVMLEALFCGTPVICFNVGGMSDIIVDGVNGYKAEQVNADSLAGAINRFIATAANFESKKIREAALKQFATTKIVSEYSQLYTSLLPTNALS